MADPRSGERSIPIVQEEAFVEKRIVDTEHVSVRTSVEAEQVIVRDTVARTQVEIRRVAIGREVDRAPMVREEDGVTIIPVIEERLVTEKKLFLVEEIHVSRSTEFKSVELPTTLRGTRVDIHRTDLTDKQEDVHGSTE